MIYKSLNYVITQLNEYLKIKFSLEEDKVILAAILDEEGKFPEGNQNKLVVTLVNMEYETNLPHNPVYAAANYKGTDRLSRPYNFNADTLVTALFKNYNESLKFLSETLFFFQKNQYFNFGPNKLNSPANKITFEVIKLTYNESHSLWGALGAKYMPSVLFKVRMFTFQDSET